MSFLSKLKSGLGKISLKRKPGGTFVGNFLRAIVNKQTDGMFGNGAMMLQEGETKEAANERLVKGLGAGLSAASDAASEGVEAPETKDSAGLGAFKSGVIMQQVKKWAVPAAVGLAAILGLKFAFSKKR